MSLLACARPSTSDKFMLGLTCQVSALIRAWDRRNGPTDGPFLGFYQLGMINNLVRCDTALTLHSAPIHLLRACSFASVEKNLARAFVPRHHRKGKFYGK